MVSPWNAPVYLTRVWCIFEIFTAHTTEQCQVDIVMPSKEKHSLEQNVINNDGGIDVLYNALSSTRVKDAKSSVASDRLAILSKVESDVGYPTLNTQVNILLRGWMQGVLNQLVKTRENTNDGDYALFCSHIGSILFENGDYDVALELLSTVLKIWKQMYGENHNKIATTYMNIGLVLKDLGDYEGAMLKYEQALAIFESIFGNLLC